MMNVINRGFITMAYGKKYCKLAEHLYMSYKLFGNCDYPFYVITDKVSAHELEKVFDGVIIKDNFKKSTTDKLMFFTDNPFDESVFIDSDCSIVDDVNYIFDEFSKNGSPISAIADYKDLSNPEKGIQFGINAIKELGITKDFPNFNGGVYYYKKCKEAENCINFMFDTVMKNYNHFGLRVRDKGAFADEPAVVVSMLKFGFTPIPPSKNIMYLVHNKTKVKWNMKDHISTYKWYEYTVHPTIIHWTIGGTESWQFEKYDAELKQKFFGYSQLWLITQFAMANIKYHFYPYLLKAFPSLHKIVSSTKIRNYYEEFYMEISGIYDLTSGKNQFIDCDCFISENTTCSARILCNTQYTKPQNIIKYITEKSKLDEDGLFLAVILYKGVLYIFSDSSTSQWVLYYTLADNKFFYSTSLKKLLILSGIKRGFDITAAKGFLKNGIVLGNRTLVNNVYKLDVCETIIVKKGKVISKRTKYAKSKTHTEQELISTLKDSILKFAKGKNNIFMPLSAGFDSNMVLNTLKDSYRIDAFTVGGKSGKNEIPIVEKNIKSYKNVTHHTCLADSSLFSKLPEIIWRLDGYVYERGIFLQYMLADLVSKSGGESLICGEDSDEHQCLLYQKEFKYYLHNKVSPIQTLDWMLQPYSWGNFVVLKKSSLMLNSFGILGCYPFATKKFTDVAASLGKKNLDKKHLYISLLKSELPKELYDGLFHAGGSTSIKTIISEVEKTNIKQTVANSELIKKLNDTQDCYKTFWNDFAELYLYEKGKNTLRLFKGYLKYVIKKVLSLLNLYDKTFEPYDDSLENNIKSYYLLLFSELFLSGKYDESFKKEKFDFEISI